MGEAFIVRRGGKAEEVLRTAVPNINFISATTTSLTFTFKNNENAEVDLYYGTTTPPTTKITLAANATSSNQTISGLNDTDTFDVYAYAIVTDPTSKKIKSEIVETQAQTLIPAPTITQVSKTTDSITFTVRNNSRVAADVTYGLTTPPTTTTLQLAANTTSVNQTISGLDDNTSYTVFAQAKVAGFTDSAIASSSVTTDEPVAYTAATGGTTFEYDLEGKRYRSHTFTSNGTFEVTTAGNGDRNQVDYLIIAGGGGGGGVAPFGYAGGGGAGGYRTTNGTSGANSSAQSKVVVTAQGYTIVIGAGGAGGPASRTNGTNGGTSSALGISASGGGGGGGGAEDENFNKVGNNANNGGSGGGGGPNSNGGTGSSNQGFSGGGNNSIFGSGGGGASSSGTSTSSGLGLSNILRNNTEERRGGGGGPSSNTANRFGADGGGNGGTPGSGNATAGAANTGGGGGGQSFINVGSTARAGVAGGSGIVVIRYEIAPTI